MVSHKERRGLTQMQETAKQAEFRERVNRTDDSSETDTTTDNKYKLNLWGAGREAQARGNGREQEGSRKTLWANEDDAGQVWRWAPAGEEQEHTRETEATAKKPRKPEKDARIIALNAITT